MTDRTFRTDEEKKVDELDEWLAIGLFTVTGLVLSVLLSLGIALSRLRRKISRSRSRVA